MSPRRVLHVVHDYPPEFRGGVERSAEMLVRRQRAAGADARVLCGSQRVARRAVVEASELDGVPIARLVRGPGLRDRVDAFRADLVPLYERVLDAFRPEVVHLHHWADLGDDLVRRAARRGVPTVVTLYDFYATCALCFRQPVLDAPCDRPQHGDVCAPCIGPRFGVDDGEVRFRVETRREAMAAELRAAAVVTAPSASHRRALAPHLPDDVAVEVVPLMSATSTALPRRARNGRLRVLHFGNLCRLKGVEFLLDAVERADPDGDRIDLRLAGALTEPDLDLRGVRQHGPYDERSLPAICADADLAVFPSFARETYGIVVDEALRLGLPVLASDRGALPERLGERGLALPAGDLDRWARMLARLADDPAALDRLQNAPLPALPAPDDVGAAFDALYDQARRAGPRPVDIEVALLRRLERFERALGDYFERSGGEPRGR
ncbi:MAG TPA: glycosyltransferase [Planctomycetota bacterium]|nr:glycosyltransferase [Planctomycetota bacterium]